jgi:hypothetical protein
LALGANKGQAWSVLLGLQRTDPADAAPPFLPGIAL